MPASCRSSCSNSLWASAEELWLMYQINSNRNLSSNEPFASGASAASISFRSTTECTVMFCHAHSQPRVTRQMCDVWRVHVCVVCVVLSVCVSKRPCVLVYVSAMCVCVCVRLCASDSVCGLCVCVCASSAASICTMRSVYASVSVCVSAWGAHLL